MDDEQIWRWLEIMPDPVVLMREDGKIAFASSQAAKLLGYTPDELVGLPLETIVPERYRQRHAERSTAYLARPVVRSMGGSLDLWALCKNGREVPVDISLSPIETAGGLLVAASIRDISDRKKAELELRSALAEVESACAIGSKRGEPLSPRGNPEPPTASTSLLARATC